MSRPVFVVVMSVVVLVPLVVFGGGGPLDVLEETASIREKGVWVLVKNETTSSVTAEVTGYYDDLTEVHTAQSQVALGPKETSAVLLVFTISDDIDPLASITENPDPVPAGIALSAALAP